MKNKRYQNNAAAGQLPLLKPDSPWRMPTELPDWRSRPIMACDLETKDDGLAQDRGPGWVYGAGYICGLAAAVEGESIYLPIRHPEGDCLDADQVRRWYDDHRKSVRMVFQKGIYDLGWIRNEWNLQPPEKLEDTIIEAFMLNETRLTYNLDSICEWLGIPGKDETLLRAAASAYGVDPKGGIHRLPARYVGPYGMQDAASTLEAHSRMLPRIVDEGSLEAYRLETDLIPLILEMRARGIRIDIPYVEDFRKELIEKRDAILRELSSKIQIGRQIDMKDLNSNAFLVKIFDAEKVPYPRTAGTERYPGGQASFESDWMKKRDHWMPSMIARAKAIHENATKFLGNYILNYAHMGRIHAEIHQTKTDDGGAATTRLAYSDPPLQQMPSRDPYLGPRTRRAFLPEKGHVWCSPDYSQQEYRLIVHFANVCHIVGADKPVEIYRNNPKADFHNIVVELTGLIRRDAKDANFAKAFRAGVPKFATMIDKSVEEAREIYERYDEFLPFVSRLAEFCDSRAQTRGFLRLLDGARAHFLDYEPRWLDKKLRDKGFREGHPMNACSLEIAKNRVADPNHPWHGCKLKRAFTYKAGNKLIQGSAARQTKLAMRECWREKIIPMIQMHDELGVSTDDEKIARRVAEIMRSVVTLTVPTIVDEEFGSNWGRAKADKAGYGATWEEAMAEVRSGILTVGV